MKSIKNTFFQIETICRHGKKPCQQTVKICIRKN